MSTRRTLLLCEKRVAVHAWVCQSTNEVLHQFKLYDILDDRNTETKTKVGQFPCT